jgi:uncharacterized membrane protein YphA (DoxX/SURF4 family)
MPSRRQYLVTYSAAYATLLVGILLITGIDALRLAIVSAVMMIMVYLSRGIEHRSHERTRANARERREQTEKQ